MIAFLALGAGLEAGLEAGFEAGFATGLEAGLAAGFEGLAALGATGTLFLELTAAAALVVAPDALVETTTFFLSLSFLAAASFAFLV